MLDGARRPFAAVLVVVGLLQPLGVEARRPTPLSRPQTKRAAEAVELLLRSHDEGARVAVQRWFSGRRRDATISRSRGKAGTTVDGRAARVLRSRQAAENDGVYFYTATDGSPRALKTLRLDPETLEDPNQRKKWKLPPLIKEVAHAYVAEAYGGPRLHRFGVVSTPGGRRLFLDFEELFPGQRFKTSKDFLKPQKIGEKHRDLARLAASYPGGDELIRKIARLVMAPLRGGIAPGDTDFAISPAGELRWIDTSRWLVATSKRALFEEYEDVIRKFLPAGHLRGEPALIPAEAHASRVFLEEVLRVLKASPRLTAREKERFLEIVFREKPRFLRRGVSQTQVLFEAGVLATPDRRADPVKVIKELYRSVPLAPPD